MMATMMIGLKTSYFNFSLDKRLLKDLVELLSQADNYIYAKEALVAWRVASRGMVGDTRVVRRISRGEIMVEKRGSLRNTTTHLES